jgi:hypothetical protein
MAYTRGNSAQIIVGAAALFTHKLGPLTAEAGYSKPAFEATKSYKDTVTAAEGWTNVGYTSTGLELTFTPNFGEVTVDQILDTARLYKQGMKVELKTSFAEATLENLLFSIAGKDSQLVGSELTLASGDIGEVPVEAGLIAVGPGTGDAAASANTERVYVAYRVLSIQNVTVAAKRDAATEFAVTFRLLPDNNANYGKIIDRTWTVTNS